MTHILTIAGSVRQGSYNARLAKLMGEKLRVLGAEVEDIDLLDYPMPLFNQDLEGAEGDPVAAAVLAQKFAAADAIFIASPEYNGSLTPLLKNTIDWVSREKVGPFKKAVFGIGAVSPGKLSGIMGLSHLRDILGKMGALMAPTSLGVGNAKTAFGDDGELTDPVQKTRADQLATQMMMISR